MKSKYSYVFQIFISFFKIGPLTFGGGYSIISLIEREFVSKKKWINEKEMSDILSVAESVPGAIALNTATFIGYRIAGWRGAVSAMLGIIFPTFVIIITLSVTYLYFHNNPMVEAAFKGIAATIIAMIINASIKVGKTAVLDKITGTIAIVSLLVLLIFDFNPFVLIILGFFVGNLIFKLKDIYKRTVDEVSYDISDSEKKRGL